MPALLIPSLCIEPNIVQKYKVERDRFRKRKKRNKFCIITYYLLTNGFDVCFERVKSVVRWTLYILHLSGLNAAWLELNVPIKLTLDPSINLTVELTLASIRLHPILMSMLFLLSFLSITLMPSHLCARFN